MLKRKANIAVFVSGGGTNLQAILDAAAAGDIPHGTVALVLSNKEGAYALERAAKADVPACTVLRGDGGQAAFEKKILEKLAEYDIDIAVLAGFLTILSADFIKAFGKPVLNVHPSLIPAFCGKGFYGLRVHEAALEKGVKVTGATVHFVNEIPDGGEIIMQKAVEVPEGITPQALQKLVMERAEWILLPRATEKICKQIVEGK